MNLPNIFNFQEARLSELYIKELLEVNEDIKEYGLVLTSEDVLQIINSRSTVLKNYGRVELSFDAAKKLIKIFGASAFVNDDNYLTIINELQEVFYYMKNETEDKLSDDRIIELMKELFEESCEGSVELLYSRIEEFSWKFRRSSLG